MEDIGPRGLEFDTSAVNETHKGSLANDLDISFRKTIVTLFKGNTQILLINDLCLKVS